MAEQNSDGTGPRAAEAELANMAVERGLATREEVDDCLATVERTDASNGRSLGDILVERGVITPTQVGRLRKSIDESRSQQIPGYRILAKLGAGAMATVFKARQLSLDRTVAIKVLPKKLSENRDYVERFYREGKAAAKLNHANIVQAFDVGEAGGYHYFVMEYVEGETLDDVLTRRRLLPESEALDVIIQIARALDHAHTQGLIHRDVKPKNIMITQSGVAKLADMGLARAASDAATASAEAGRAYGTPYYISPEQIRGELDIDFRADIYSLGATLYRTVTGKVPFEGSTPVAVMHKHLKEPLVPPDHINTNLTTGLGEVVEVMMAKDRDRRYGSTRDLLLDLEAIQAGQPPLQARKQIDASVLTGLAGQTAEYAEPPSEEAAAPGTQTLAVILLAVALAISLLVNIIQWLS